MGLCAHSAPSTQTARCTQIALAFCHSTIAKKENKDKTRCGPTEIKWKRKKKERAHKQHIYYVKTCTQLTGKQLADNFAFVTQNAEN